MLECTRPTPRTTNHGPTEDMIRNAAAEAIGTTALTWEGNAIDLGPRSVAAPGGSGARTQPANHRCRLPRSRRTRAPLRSAARAGEGELRWASCCWRSSRRRWKRGLTQPTFNHALPVEVSPLHANPTASRAHRSLERSSGKELANGFSELMIRRPGRAVPRAGRGEEGGERRTMHFDATTSARSKSACRPPAGWASASIAW